MQSVTRLSIKRVKCNTTRVRPRTFSLTVDEEIRRNYHPTVLIAVFHAASQQNQTKPIPLKDIITYYYVIRFDRYNVR